MNILFTGAFGGISNSVIIELLKRKKYHIFLTVRTEEQLKTIKERYKKAKNVECFKLDITNSNDRKKLENLDIDILVNNAAISYGGSISEIPFNRVRENFEVNVFASFEIVQIVIKKMIEKGKGKIIIMASLAGIVPLNFIGVYSATKASIIKLTTTLKNEMKMINKNIKIVLIEPGLYHTGFNQVMLENKYDWMGNDSYFRKDLNKIRNKENLMISILEKRKLDTIVEKIVEAIEAKNPKFIYRAPVSQVLGAKIYDLFMN